MKVLKRCHSFWFFVYLFFLTSCYQETPVRVVSDFSAEVRDHNYAAPVVVVIENKTSGADQFRWTFEGGEPGFSTEKNPGEIIYREAGTYTICLEAWNQNYRDEKTFELIIDRKAILDFEPEIQFNAFVPAEVKLINKSVGATSFEWIFEGGNPAMSHEEHPPLIYYNAPGEYRIILKAGAGRKNHELIRTIVLLPGLQPHFVLSPFFECEDMQAPWKGNVQNCTVSGLNYSWKTSGGALKNDTATHTEVYYDTPGTYTLQLEARNGKQVKTIDTTITVLENTNLQILENVRLGISSAKSIGSIYSCRLRRVLKESEIDRETGPLIDFVFFGLNDKFSYCRFLSPDRAGDFVFEAIPGASKTYIVHDPEAAGLSFDFQDFQSMKNDAKLRTLDVRLNDTGEAYFRPESLPYLVLFETSDGRKGAICIKVLELSGDNSCIVADVKVQKRKNG